MAESFYSSFLPNFSGLVSRVVRAVGMLERKGLSFMLCQAILKQNERLKVVSKWLKSSFLPESLACLVDESGGLGRCGMSGRIKKQNAE